MKHDIDRLLAQTLEFQTRSLVEEDKGIETTRMEMTLLENLKRIHTYLKRIVREVLPAEVQD